MDIQGNTYMLPQNPYFGGTVEAQQPTHHTKQHKKRNKDHDKATRGSNSLSPTLATRQRVVSPGPETLIIHNFNININIQQQQHQFSEFVKKGFGLPLLNGFFCVFVFDEPEILLSEAPFFMKLRVIGQSSVPPIYDEQLSNLIRQHPSFIENNDNQDNQISVPRGFITVQPGETIGMFKQRIFRMCGQSSSFRRFWRRHNHCPIPLDADSIPDLSQFEKELKQQEKEKEVEKEIFQDEGYDNDELKFIVDQNEIQYNQRINNYSDESKEILIPQITEPQLFDLWTPNEVENQLKDQSQAQQSNPKQRRNSSKDSENTQISLNSTDKLERKEKKPKEGQSKQRKKQPKVYPLMNMNRDTLQLLPEDFQLVLLRIPPTQPSAPGFTAKNMIKEELKNNKSNRLTNSFHNGEQDNIKEEKYIEDESTQSSFTVYPPTYPPQSDQDQQLQIDMHTIEKKRFDIAEILANTQQYEPMNQPYYPSPSTIAHNFPGQYPLPRAVEYAMPRSFAEETSYNQQWPVNIDDYADFCHLHDLLKREGLYQSQYNK
ncbi:MAG: hypothetical protein EZS28_007414 [Streblomastix strix]|uniref:Uncharacterized protein n=1 Tax=Streblomastix strix TaxID=222440 RepID=A0A5J4WQ18_9EUKA|nr:MAG: hypothetical protein EZS28_007414 [Streblomastix strix]